MLTSLRIQNFKAWKDTRPVHLAPLTVIFGSNSSGKSSLGHLLLALKQTMQLADRKRSLHLGDETALIDLGTFADCLHAHDTRHALKFALSWKLPVLKELSDALGHGKYAGDGLSLSATVTADRAGQPQTTEFSYTLEHDRETTLQVTHRRNTSGGGALESKPLKLVHAVGRKWPVELPEKFYRFADRTLSRYQNADFLAEFALETERVLDGLYTWDRCAAHPGGSTNGPETRPMTWGSKANMAIACCRNTGTRPAPTSPRAWATRSSNGCCRTRVMGPGYTESPSRRLHRTCTLSFRMQHCSRSSTHPTENSPLWPTHTAPSLRSGRPPIASGWAGHRR